jgi:hypothetical protein
MTVAFVFVAAACNRMSGKIHARGVPHGRHALSLQERQKRCDHRNSRGSSEAGLTQEIKKGIIKQTQADSRPNAHAYTKICRYSYVHGKNYANRTRSRCCSCFVTLCRDFASGDLIYIGVFTQWTARVVMIGRQPGADGGAEHCSCLHSIYIYHVTYGVVY